MKIQSNMKRLCTAALGLIFLARGARATSEGGVLLVRGQIDLSGLTTNSAEIFDPATRSSTATNNSITYNPPANVASAMTALGNGKVLLAGGGMCDGCGTTNAASLYDPASRLWQVAASMNYGRDQFGLVTLADGNALAFGGCAGACSGPNALGQYIWTVGRSAEIYNYLTNTWSTVAPMTTVRGNGPSGVLLHDGRVLVCGGSDGFSTTWTSCELYDPQLNNWAQTGSMPAIFAEGGPMTVLPDGRVLALPRDGRSSLQTITWSPATGQWSPTGNLQSPQGRGALVSLNDGEVLLAGGENVSGAVATAQIFNPATNSWRMTGSMAAAREGQAAVLLPTGRVLVAGGINSAAVLSSAELFDPATGLWTPAGALTSPRVFWSDHLWASLPGATPPSVNITSPADGATVSGFVVITATTTGNVNVAYTLDGAGYLDAVLTAAPYSFSWDTAKVANGTHTLTAGAWDAVGRQWVAGSAPIALTVNNPIKPLAIVSPKDGETWMTGSTQQIKWTGGNPAWNTVNISMISGDGGQVVEGIAGSLPNTGTYNWTVNLPAGAYLAYIEGDRGQPDQNWTYGQPFLVVSSSSPASMVTIGSPANGASVSKSVFLTAAVTGNIGSVSYTLDGSSLGAPLTTPPYNLSWDSTQVSNGTHTLVAGGWDKNTGQGPVNSSPITVTVNNAVKPSVTILTPAPGTVLSGSVTVTAAVTGNVGAVGYTLDGAGYLTNALVTPPYSFIWDTTQVAAGTHTLTAGAWDAGTRAWLAGSAPVAVTIRQAPISAPPIISSVTASSMWIGFATITWQTDRAADSQVIYGTTTAYGQATALDGAMATHHSVLFGGLLTARTYHFRVQSKDAAGNLAVSDDSTVYIPTQLNVVSPNNSSAWTTGSTQKIQWTGGNPSWNTINIQLVSGDGRQVVEGIAGYPIGLPNSGTYNWTVNVPSGTYLVYIEGDRGLTDQNWTYGSTFTAVNALPAVPAQPIGLVGIALGISSITWTWNAVANAASYNIYQASSPTTLIGDVNAPLFVETGLSANTSYGIVVAGVNVGGMGPVSSSATATTAVALTTVNGVVSAKEGGKVERDDHVDVEVPEGALKQDLKISIEPERERSADEKVRKSDQLKSKNLTPISEGVEYGPEGTTFSKAVSLTLVYDPANLPSGVKEDDLKVDYWNPNTMDWEPMPSIVNKASHTVVALTTHFSLYQVLGPVPQPQAAAPSVDQSFDMRDVYVFPNPARGGAKPTFHVETGIVDSVQIKVYSVSGWPVMEAELSGTPPIIDSGSGPRYAYEYVWDGHIASGVYLYVVTAKSRGNKLTKTGKFGVVR